MMGSMDPDFCILLNVGLWLEISLGAVVGMGQQPHVFGFCEHEDEEKAGDWIKTMVYDVLRKALIALGIDPKSMDYHNGSVQYLFILLVGFLNLLVIYYVCFHGLVKVNILQQIHNSNKSIWDQFQHLKMLLDVGLMKRF